MPTFAYTARSKSGEKIVATVEANNRRAAMQQIERMGQIPVSVAEQTGPAVKAPGAARPRFVLWRGAKARMPMRDVLTFTVELSDLLASGMKLGNALTSLSRRTTGRAGDTVISDLRDQIIQGASLSDALARHPGTFSNLYASMIRAGEASGAMHEVLRRLVVHYERLQELRGKIVGALVYPLIVLTMGIGTLIFAMVYVVPKFKVIFDQFGGTLPLPTQILIKSSEWIVKYGWGLLIGIGIASVLAGRAMKTKAGRLWFDGLRLRMPLVRGVIAAGTYANFASTLSTLLANGVPVLKALKIVENTVSNAVVAREIANARDRVTDGTTISGPLAASKVFPPVMIDMLAIGEETGDMSGALTHIAGRYESELDRNVKVFTTALEPILIVFVAVMVGFVAISILLAVFNMTNGLDA